MAQYAMADIQAYIQNLRDQGLTGEALNQAIAAAATQHGVNPLQIGLALKVPTETVTTYLNNYQGAAPQLPAVAQTAVSDQDIQNYVASAQQTNPDTASRDQQLYAAAQQYGVTPDQFDSALGRQQGTAQNWVNQQGGISDQEIQDRVAQITANTQPGQERDLALYNEAQRYGITPDRFDSALGRPQGTAQNWMNGFQASGSPEYGLAGSMGTTGRAIDLLGGSTGAAINLIGAGGNTAREDLFGGYGAAAQQLSPWQQQGQAASQLMGSLSGAMGPEAQAQAFQNYQSSPGQQFLIDRMERGATGTAAATGGLGGGNVQAELQRRRMGLAQQDFGNSYNRLAGLANTGFSAANSLAGNAMTTGANLGNVATGTANTQANAGMLGAGNMSNMLGTQAGYQQQAGRDIASQTMNTSNLLAQMQANAGNNASNIYGNTASGLGNIYNQAGTGQGNLALSTGSYLSGLEGTYGQGVGGMYGNMGNAQATGINNQYNAYKNALGGLTL